jgi:hypothetical protein
MQKGEGCDAGWGRRHKISDPRRCHSSVTALRWAGDSIGTLVYKCVAAANQPETLRYFTAQSYQYARWPRLLKRRASRPTAGHFLDAITIQISSFLFNYECIYQFVQFQCCFFFTRIDTSHCDTDNASNSIAARRGLHSVHIYVYRDATPCRLVVVLDVSSVAARLSSGVKLLDSECKGTTVPRNVGSYSPNDTASHAGRQITLLDAHQLYCDRQEGKESAASER